MRTHIVLPPCVWATVIHEYTTCLSTTPAQVCVWHFVVENDDCEICCERLQTSLLVLIHVYLHYSFAPTSTPTTYIYVCMHVTLLFSACHFPMCACAVWSVQVYGNNPESDFGLSHMSLGSSSSWLLASCSNGQALLVDTRTEGKATRMWNLHGRKIKTIHINPRQEDIFCTACVDG